MLIPKGKFPNISSVILFIVFFLYLDCSNYSREVRMELYGAAYCRSTMVLYNGQTPTKEKVRDYLLDPILSAKYSAKAIRIASAYGFAEELKRHTELKNKMGTKDSPKSPEIIDLEILILKKINLVVIDISSIASEMNCYIDRFTEILTMMKEKEDDIESSNTIYAIMSGAIAAIIDGLTIYDNAVNQKVIITGGLLVSYFSYLAYKPLVTVEFRPRSTNLKDLWNNPEKTENYSTAMWFLMTKKINDADDPTYRDLLINRWIENHFLGEAGEEREQLVDLFFGKGGVSTYTNLYNRREMITQIRTIISLFEQDTRALTVEFLR